MAVPFSPIQKWPTRGRQYSLLAATGLTKPLVSPDWLGYGWYGIDGTLYNGATSVTDWHDMETAPLCDDADARPAPIGIGKVPPSFQLDPLLQDNAGEQTQRGGQQMVSRPTRLVTGMAPWLLNPKHITGKFQDCGYTFHACPDMYGNPYLLIIGNQPDGGKSNPYDWQTLVRENPVMFNGWFQGSYAFGAFLDVVTQNSISNGFTVPKSVQGGVEASEFAAQGWVGGQNWNYPSDIYPFDINRQRFFSGVPFNFKDISDAYKKDVNAQFNAGWQDQSLSGLGNALSQFDGKVVCTVDSWTRIAVIQGSQSPQHYADADNIDLVNAIVGTFSALEKIVTGIVSWNWGGVVSGAISLVYDWYNFAHAMDNIGADAKNEFQHSKEGKPPSAPTGNGPTSTPTPTPTTDTAPPVSDGSDSTALLVAAVVAFLVL